MKNRNESDYFTEFGEFEQSTHEVPPLALSLKIREKIKTDIQPSFKIVMANLFALHAIAGGTTLLVCPQFGVGPIGGGEGILGFVEKYGHVVCGLFCGAFFVSFTALLSWVVLRREIQRELKHRQWIAFPLLGMISFIALSLFSYMVNGAMPTLHAEFLLPWFLAFTLFPILLFKLKFAK